MKLILSIICVTGLSFASFAQGDMFSVGNRTACPVTVIIQCDSGEYEEFALGSNSSYSMNCATTLNYVKLDFSFTPVTDFEWIIGSPAVDLPVNCNGSAVSFDEYQFFVNGGNQYTVGVY